MQRYDEARSREVLEFLKDYAELCGKHKLCLSHEDSHGGFIVTQLDGDNIDWVLAASELVPGEPDA